MSWRSFIPTVPCRTRCFRATSQSTGQWRRSTQLQDAEALPLGLFSERSVGCEKFRVLAPRECKIKHVVGRLPHRASQKESLSIKLLARDQHVYQANSKLNRLVASGQLQVLEAVIFPNRVD